MKTYLLLFALLYSAGVFAIDNDNCATATLLNVTTTCTPISYSTLDATTSGDGVPSCGFYQGSDAWFTFMAPSSGDFRVEIIDEGIGNPEYQLYSGTCGALVPVDCQGVTSNYSDPAYGGQVFYLQLFSLNNDSGVEFSLCVMETTPPVNNHCENATTLVVGTECTPMSFTNLYATDDFDAGPNPSCGFYSGGDVWFELLVPADGQFRIELTDEGAGNPEAFLYSGSCGGLVPFACFFSESFININEPSLGGEIMTLRVFGVNSKNLIEFGLCAYEVDYVSNDDCANAIPLVVGTECTPVVFSTEFATNETGIAPNPSCGFYKGGDVWFTVEVPASGHLRVEDENIDGNSNFSVYTGTCGNMVEYECQNSSGDLNINDLSLGGETVYIRYFRYNSQNSCSFSVCVYEPNTASNDFCENATVLSVGTECNLVSYSNEGATPDGGIGSPSCGFYQGSDVWFTFDLPASGHLRIDLENTGAGGIAYQLYSGDCSSFTTLDCRANFNHMNIHEDALAGQQLYLRVYGYNSEDLRNFDLCVWEPNIPDYDFCETAQVVELTGGCQMVEYSNEFTTNELNEAPNPGCGFYQGNDVWFAITVPASGLLIVETGEVDFQRPCLAMYSGDCSDLTLLECNTNGTDVTSGKIILDDISLAGETLYFRVYRYNGLAGGRFTLCAYDPALCGVYEFEEGTQTVCNPENGKYDQEIIVSYINAPTTGFLNVNGIDYPIETSPQSIIITDLFANYEFVNVTAFFTDNPECSYSETFVYREPLTCYCPGDINNDETVTAADLLILLGAYGCSSGCSIDLNEDGTTDTADLLLLLGQIGQDCPGL